MAVVQVLVHLVCFLHMNTKSDEGWNMTAFVFTVLIIAIPGCRLHLDYVEPQLQHDDALRAAVMMFKQYLQVTKPGHHLWQPDLGDWGDSCWPQRAALIIPCLSTRWLGVSLVVASGCVFNNYIDRDIDRKMERTKNRVLVKGLISPAVSLVYATLLGIAGFMLLWFGANPLACWLGG